MRLSTGLVRAFPPDHCRGEADRCSDRHDDETRERQCLSLRPSSARQQLLRGEAATGAHHVRDVFCEPTRTQIVRALEVGALSVSELAAALGHSETAISQHLRVLRQGGVVSPKRAGRFVYYTLTRETAATEAVQALELVARSA